MIYQAGVNQDVSKLIIKVAKPRRFFLPAPEDFKKQVQIFYENDLMLVREVRNLAEATS